MWSKANPKSQSDTPSLALPLKDIRGGNVYVVGLNEVIDMNKTNTKSEVKRQCRAVVFGLLASPAEIRIKALKSQSNNPSLALPLKDIRGGNNYVVGLKP
ncbi:hypothetical protein D104_03425 [Marinomonas profundimaris]|uniref:Uncharacterized protein n=1 Tax=Marinomonas profundimaris TaxID=1208321 RepID=W1RYU7_9GAMM|nr:hypothetical protein D104_03425 [Marinomonas profundimaris]